MEEINKKASITHTPPWGIQELVRAKTLPAKNERKQLYWIKVQKNQRGKGIS